MLTRIEGTLETVDANRAVVVPAAGAFACEVLLPAYLAESLAPKTGETVTLHTILYLESNNQGAAFTPRLLGFASPRDRQFFELLTTVKGLGNRRALRAMTEPPGWIAAAIVQRDAPLLQRLPEIGKRLAETIIAELKSKAEPFALVHGDPGEAGARRTDPGRRGDDDLPAHAEEAVDALIALGETPHDARSLVRRALSRDGDLDSTENILRAALAHR